MWSAPIFGNPSNVTRLDWHLRHLALMTIIVSLIAGYIDLGRFLPATVGKQIVGRRSSSAATWVCTIPITVLLYSIMRFHPSSSVLLGPSVSAFRYFFDTQLTASFRNSLPSDWAARVLTQVQVTAPFYAGIAYSFGAFVWKQRLLPALFGFKENFEPATLRKP